MQLLRKILFYLFTLLYLVLCPLTVLYALGYILLPEKVEEGLVKTGLIYLETLPTKANVFVDQKRIADRTPATVRSLLPGNYTVKVERRDYIPWMRQVRVEAGKASVFENILLLPVEFKDEEHSSLAFKNLLNLEETDYFLLSAEDTLNEFFIFNWKDEEMRPLLPANSAFRKAGFRRLFHSRKSPFLLIEATKDEKAVYLWFDLRNEDAPPKDLSHLFVEDKKPEQVIWEADNDNYLFIFETTNVHRVDVVKETLFPFFLTQVQGFGFAGNQMYAIRGGSLMRVKKDSRQISLGPLKPSENIEHLFNLEEFYKIEELSDDFVLFSDSKGRLLSNRLPYELVAEDMKNYNAYPHLKSLLVWTERELGVLSYRKPWFEKSFFEKGLMIEWVFLEGKDITDAFFVQDSSHILYRDRNSVHLLDLTETSLGSGTEIATVQPGSSIFYSDKNGKLFYLKEGTHHLHSLTLVPETGFLSVGSKEFEKMLTGEPNS